jgi:hypothetical protein
MLKDGIKMTEDWGELLMVKKSRFLYLPFDLIILGGKK